MATHRALLSFAAVLVWLFSVTDADRTARLSHGVDATIEDFPYQVSMQYLFSYGDERTHYCGGAILDKSHVITTAHCIVNEPLDWVVAAAGVTVVRDYDNPDRVALPVKSVTAHPLYTKGSPEHDIAIIEVSGEFPLDGITTAAIPLQTETPEPGTSCTITGWGYRGETTGIDDLADELQAATLTVADASECAPDVSEGDSLICAVGESAPCEGDDGGPLVCSGLLSGLTQFLSARCGSANHAVFTSIAAHAQWVKEQLSQADDS